MSGPFRPGMQNREKCMEIMMFPPPNPLGRVVNHLQHPGQIAIGGKDKGRLFQGFLGSIMMV